AATYFFKTDFDYEEKGVRKFFSPSDAVEILAHGREVLAKTEPFDLPTVETAYRNLSHTLGVAGSKLIHPTRLALTGKTFGPGLFDIIVTLGHTKCLERLDRAINWIKNNLG
ncbi:MAG TPA: glutamate--tRNA ligase, partial [Desulfotomaculum sp.]|nr:glutamate--tRNA ligase [Desulfotomaculum sp.]